MCQRARSLSILWLYVVRYALANHGMHAGQEASGRLRRLLFQHRPVSGLKHTLLVIYLVVLQQSTLINIRCEIDMFQDEIRVELTMISAVINRLLT